MNENIAQNASGPENSAEEFTDDEGFQKIKNRKFFIGLETFLFSKRLREYSSETNKIDINLASLLFDTVNAINDFLSNAEVQELDEPKDAKVNDFIPNIEANICQAHRSYFCSACNHSIKTSPQSFNEHFFSDKHLRNLRKIEQTLPKQKVQLPGSTQNLNNTEQASGTRPILKKERLNSTPSLNTSQTIDNLPKKMIDFLSNQDLESSSIQLILEGRQIQNSQKYKKVCDLLERRLACRFPKVKVFPFGSMVIGLGRPEGDLDIFVDIDDCYFQKPSKMKIKDAIYHTQKILMSSQQWSDFEPVQRARTPILRAYCKSERIDCDLSFSNGLSTCNTALMGYYIDLQPICRKIAVFVKWWASKISIGLNSYILIQMVIFYLQSENALPPVHLLQQNIQPAYVDGWRCNFRPLDLVELKIPLCSDYKKYLAGFFKFYGYEFDFKNNVISILMGVPLPKLMFDHGKECELPPEFDTFRQYMKNIELADADEVEDLFSNHKPMVIQDPFELIHNVSKGVQITKINKIINYFRRTYDVLAKRSTSASK